MNSTSQVSSPEDDREDDQIRGRSSRLMNYPGWLFSTKFNSFVIYKQRLPAMSIFYTKTPAIAAVRKAAREPENSLIRKLVPVLAENKGKE